MLTSFLLFVIGFLIGYICHDKLGEFADAFLDRAKRKKNRD